MTLLDLRYFKPLIPVILLFPVVIASCRCIVSQVGGAFSYPPEKMETSLSVEAKRFMDETLKGIDANRIVDYHVHLVGLGAGGTGAFVNPSMMTWLHPIKRIQFAIYMSACAIEDPDQADSAYLDRLVALVRSQGNKGRYGLLALDKYYDTEERENLEKTEFYVPNDYLFEVVDQYPDCFYPAVSIHPFRPDALSTLKRWSDRGAKFVKWLPNAQGIDPSDPRCIPFYEIMAERGMVLLTHTGEEKAVESEEDQRFGNPLLLRAALDRGVKVIAAHCASLGESIDLDDPNRSSADNFDLFLRLMDEPRYEGLLFGDISAILQINRLSRPVLTLLQRKDLHRRLVYGSDYPLPAINFLVQTRSLVRRGMITREERKYLNEIYEYNPLLFNLLLTRTVRHPKTGERFPPEVFMEHPALPL